MDRPAISVEFHKYISHLKDTGDLPFDKTFTEDDIELAKIIIDKCSNNNRWISSSKYDRSTMVGHLVLLKYPIGTDGFGYTIAMNSMPSYVSLFRPMSHDYDNVIKPSKCLKVMKLENVLNVYIILEFCIDYISKYCTIESNYYSKVIEFLSDYNN